MNHRIIFLALIVAALVAVQAFAHAGEVHSYMGTVTSVGENGTFRMKTTKGEDVSFVTTKATTFRFADNSPAQRSDVTDGSRVVVEISKDGKTATGVKIAKRDR